jgi:cAMP-dependent protein kinase regulator
VPKDEATKEAMSNAIRTNLLFSHLDDSERQDIFDAMFSKNAESGEMIIRQGDNGDNFYIIHEGTAEVSMKIN